MYSHIQLGENGEFLRRLEGAVAIHWDSNNYCTPLALEFDGKAEEFRVHFLAQRPAPDYNRITQRVVELPPALENGQWTQQWAVQDLPQEMAAANLAAAQALVWDRIKAERDRRCNLGVKVGGHWYHSDAQKSRIQQLGLTVYIPPGTAWKTLTFTGPAVWVPMTHALAMAIVEATAQSDVAIHTAAEVHNAAMCQSAAPDAYDFSGGWPPSIEDEAYDAGIHFDATNAA